MNWTARHRRSRRQGSSLVVSVLILLTLTSVGVVSIIQTNTDLMVAGNLVRSAQAHMAGEGGTAHSMIFMTQTLNINIQDMLQRNYAAASTQKNVALVSMSTAIPDPGGAGASQHIPIALAAAGPPPAMAQMRQDFAYQVDAVYVDEDPAAPGASVDIGMCWFIFDFNSNGGIPTGLSETVDTTMQQLNTIVVRNRARASLGMWKCTRDPT